MKTRKRKTAGWAIGLGCSILFLLLCEAAFAAEGESFVNSVGMKMLPAPAGEFVMGSPEPSVNCWDEAPAHKVRISKSFYLSETEVTMEQFRKFRPDFRGTKAAEPYAAGLSWYDAVAFCEWLNTKEGKPYRLPTEAEWEYACRAGTAGPYWSGEKPPSDEAANAWGLKNTHTGPREWCLDWYGPYPEDGAEQADPVGAAAGMARVVRGGALDTHDKWYDRAFYARSANRAGIAPGFGIMKGTGSPQAETAPVKEGNETLLPGLTGARYGDPGYERLKAQETVSSLDTDFRTVRRAKSWSCLLEGYITAPADGEVVFHAQADNVVLLAIDGKTLINADCGKSEQTGTCKMEKGKKYPIKVGYNHREADKTYLKIEWSYAAQTKTAIPASALQHAKEPLNEPVKDPAAKTKDPAAKAEEPAGPGHHLIGFRVAQAPMPETPPAAVRTPFVLECVKQNKDQVKMGPDPAKPWFRKRWLLPMPPDNEDNRNAIRAAGLHPGMMTHNHSPAMEVCPNGDILLVIYTSEHEYEQEVSLMSARLRFGEEQWDMPDILFDFPDANDHAPCLWTENDTMYFFWGSPRMDYAYPFQWMTSRDNGHSWSEAQFPRFVTPIREHSRQPINTIVRGLDNTAYVSSDAEGDSSVLWVSKDNGKTWSDPCEKGSTKRGGDFRLQEGMTLDDGRTAGRHTTFVLLKDGSILGMGGKNSDIDGFMPKAVSKDSGKTWKVSKTPFASLGSNQRPCVVRLQSGRLFFCGDFQHRKTGEAPPAIKERGSYVALSEDEGETWLIKKMVGTQPHEADNKADTLGYSVARQAPNGVIHLITTMNTPCLHFEMNEAWILDPKAGMEPYKSPTVSNVKEYAEKDPAGKTVAAWSAGTVPDGRCLLDGKQTFFFPDGKKKWEAAYKAGRKVGEESLWGASDGRKIWIWRHGEDGASIWTQYWPNGEKKSETTWREGRCEGAAKRWDPSGKLIGEARFAGGKMQ